MTWLCSQSHMNAICHDDVIKWKHFPRYWPLVRGIHRSPVNSPHKGQWRGALMLSLICDWINDWANDRNAGDLRRNRAHYDVTVKQYAYRVPGDRQECRAVWSSSQQGRPKNINSALRVTVEQVCCCWWSLTCFASGHIHLLPWHVLVTVKPH